MLTRRAWLAHCTLLAVAASAAGPLQAAARPAKILVVGDSLSAEYGLERGTGWVALLEKRLAAEKYKASVVNASISGDTTSGGRARLEPLLKQYRPTHVIFELGANDGLRGLPLAGTRDNLDAMVREAKAAGARVLIVGMALPPNYGRKYNDEFMAIFADIAKKEGTGLVPFLLKGVADAPDAGSLFQADRLHPLARAHPTMLANVWPALKPMLTR